MIPDLAEAFAPFEFMLRVLLRAQLGRFDGAYTGVVIHLDEGGRLLVKVLQRHAVTLGMPLAGEPVVLGTPASFLAFVPAPVLLDVLGRLGATQTVAAIRPPPDAEQVRLVWIDGDVVLSGVLQAEPCAPPNARGGSA